MTQIAKAEPRFDLDLQYGHEGERNVQRVFDLVAAGSPKVEVKTKRRFIDLFLYVETHHDPGARGVFVPSGISVTTADLWVFNVGTTGVSHLIPTALLREAIQHPSAQDKTQTDGSCPTRGKLVHLDAIFATHVRMQQTAPRDRVTGEDDGDPERPFVPVRAEDIRWSSS
jgi:hypothetical protein